MVLGSPPKKVAGIRTSDYGGGAVVSSSFGRMDCGKFSHLVSFLSSGIPALKAVVKK